MKDPWGNIWWIHTRIVELSPDEMMQRMAEPGYAAGMKYVQDSLSNEMSSRAR